MTQDLIQQVKQLRRLAAASEASADDLLYKYGHGVRPSWVSSEVASHGERADRYLRAAARVSMEAAVASAAVIGPITAAACHGVCLSSLYKILDQPEGTFK